MSSLKLDGGEINKVMDLIEFWISDLEERKAKYQRDYYVEMNNSVMEFNGLIREYTELQKTLQERIIIDD